MDRTAELVSLFKALGDETRLRLVMLLSQQQPGAAMCVSRLAWELDTTVSNVSQHLRVLKELGLLRRERRHHRIHYFLDGERLADYVAMIQELLGDQFVVRR